MNFKMFGNKIKTVLLPLVIIILISFLNIEVSAQITISDSIFDPLQGRCHWNPFLNPYSLERDSNVHKNQTLIKSKVPKILRATEEPKLSYEFTPQAKIPSKISSNFVLPTKTVKPSMRLQKSAADKQFIVSSAEKVTFSKVKFEKYIQFRKPDIALTVGNQNKPAIVTELVTPKASAELLYAQIVKSAASSFDTMVTRANKAKTTSANNHLEMVTRPQISQHWKGDLSTEYTSTHKKRPGEEITSSVATTNKFVKK